jgi:dipeptidase E
MQRLYLASHRFDGLPAFLDADPRGLRVTFVPTAMGVLEDRSALEEDLGALDAMGFAVEQIELHGMSSRELADRLGRSDLVFVSGGNPYHLLLHAILSGFVALVPPLVRGGRLVYVGVSGGAMLAGPDLLPAASPRTRGKAPELTVTTAMGLVPFTVMPHHNDPARQARHRAVLEQDAGRGRVVPLADDQAIEVHGADWRIVPLG